MPEFDMVCETVRGCDPIPVIKAKFGAVRRTDPRGRGADQARPEEAQALEQPDEVVKALTASKDEK